MENSLAYHQTSCKNISLKERSNYCLTNLTGYSNGYQKNCLGNGKTHQYIRTGCKNLELKMEKCASLFKQVEKVSRNRNCRQEIQTVLKRND